MKNPSSNAESAWPSCAPWRSEDANKAKNVHCMQGDRHVFIEVSGSRIAQ